MKVSSIQLDMRFCGIEYNYEHAEELIRETKKKEDSDVIVLPETWTTGFYPTQSLPAYCDKNGEKVKAKFSSLAEELSVNIVAGSVATLKNGKAYNTAYVFSRNGECVAEYDKTHLFTPMNEDKFFVICYDIRFPELARTLALKGAEMLFAVSQWPDKRIPHLEILTQARAIENQMFVVCCNSCGKTPSTVFGGASQTVDPLGVIIAKAGTSEEVITADCDISVIKEIRESINVFKDRKTEIYKI